MLGGTSGGRRFSGLPSAREATVQEEDTSDGDDPNRPRPSSSSSSDGGGSVSHWEMSGQRHLAATRPGQKPRIAVLGTGWAASRLMKDLDTRLCDVVCVSPRNHMVFTPLLASTCVGTLEFRSVAEPIVRIQPALSASPDSFFFLGRCRSIDPHRHEVYGAADRIDSNIYIYTHGIDIRQSFESDRVDRLFDPSFTSIDHWIESIRCARRSNRSLIRVSRSIVDPSFESGSNRSLIRVGRSMESIPHSSRVD
jgi:hypothetical protein